MDILHKWILAVVVVAAAVATAVAAGEGTDRPVIAVVSLPYDDNDVSKGSSIPGAYVGFLESAGARVVPLLYDLPAAAQDALLGAVNGVLFTGGGLSLAADTRYYQTAERIFARATKLWETAREPLPLWGTCMGFQLLCILASGGNHSVLSEHAYDSTDVAWPLVLTPAAATSFLFAPTAPTLRGTAADIRAAATKRNVTFNWHHDGVAPAVWDANPVLAARLAVLSTNVDRAGTPFVSTVEGCADRPLYGTQWHPERAGFAWDTHEHPPHSDDAVAVGNWMARRFVARARESSQSFGTARVPSIHDHPVTRSGDLFTYVFKPAAAL